jgi:hypothetical protein
MKTCGTLLVAVALLSACAQRADQTKISVSWPPGYAYVPVCKEMVRYHATGFEIQGIKVSVPSLGGSGEVGGVKIDPKVVNQAYQTTQTLDFYFRSTCPLLASYSTNQAKFEQAVEDMRAAQVKLTQLALLLQTAQLQASPAPTAVNPPATEGTKTATKPAASPVETPTSKQAPAASTAGSTTAKHKTAVKQKLAKWVDAYGKKSKAKVVRAPPKSNTTLGLPATAPTPAPLPK